MRDDVGRKAPDERAAKDQDMTTPLTSSSLIGPTRTTSAPPSPPRQDYETQTSLPVKPSKTKKCAQELSCPHPTTLGENVKQYSPSVNKTPQSFQHTKRTTTGPNRQTQKTYNHKRKRPNITYSHTPDSEAIGSNASSETQQIKVNLKVTHASKRSKSSHPTSTITKAPKPGIPINNSPYKRTPNLGRHGNPPHLDTCPQTKHITISPSPPNNPPQQKTPPQNLTGSTQTVYGRPASHYH